MNVLTASVGLYIALMCGMLVGIVKKFGKGGD